MRCFQLIQINFLFSYVLLTDAQAISVQHVSADSNLQLASVLKNIVSTYPSLRSKGSAIGWLPFVRFAATSKIVPFVRFTAA